MLQLVGNGWFAAATVETQACSCFGQEQNWKFYALLTSKSKFLGDLDVRDRMTYSVTLGILNSDFCIKIELVNQKLH